MPSQAAGFAIKNARAEKEPGGKKKKEACEKEREWWSVSHLRLFCVRTERNVQIQRYVRAQFQAV
jgi:hypothetical protein